MMPKILLVDDHGGFRDMLKKLIKQKFNEIEIVEAGTGEDAVALAIKEKPEITLMDIRLPKMDGFQAARDIRTKLPGCKIIALSMFDFNDKKGNKDIDVYIRKSEFEHQLFPKLKSYINEINERATTT
jgi:YesN/AraC family two-component response regulator